MALFVLGFRVEYLQTSKFPFVRGLYELQHISYERLEY